jgi:hypothetical protein
MKFQCYCGHVIRDQTDYLPCKGSLLRDEDDERFWDAAELALHAPEPTNSTRSSVYLRAIRAWLAHTVRAFECVACGRLYLERERGTDPMVSFVPESGHPEHILASPRGSPIRQPDAPVPPAG